MSDSAEATRSRSAGVQTHYLEAGEGEPLVLIHGGGAGADAKGNWEACIPAYAEHFRVLAPDMIGFGHSERPDPKAYSYGQTNRNRHMIEFIEKVAGGPAHVIGNSMGGATSLLGVAINRPRSGAAKLVLMGDRRASISPTPTPARRAALGGYDYTVEGMRRLVGDAHRTGLQGQRRADRLPPWPHHAARRARGVGRHRRAHARRSDDLSRARRSPRCRRRPWWSAASSTRLPCWRAPTTGMLRADAQLLGLRAAAHRALGDDGGPEGVRGRHHRLPQRRHVRRSTMSPR